MALHGHLCDAPSPAFEGLLVIVPHAALAASLAAFPRLGWCRRPEGVAVGGRGRQRQIYPKLMRASRFVLESALLNASSSEMCSFLYSS